MSFCTVINCMDGRVQLPVIHYLRDYFQVDYVDSITEPGPILALSAETDSPMVKSILNRLNISVEKHHSVGLAIVAHYDCAGNPEEKEAQMVQLKKSLDFIRTQYSDLIILGLWVDANGQVHKIYD